MEGAGLIPHEQAQQRTVVQVAPAETFATLVPDRTRGANTCCDIRVTCTSDRAPDASQISERLVDFPDLLIVVTQCPRPGFLREEL